jgi:hypothetical protein
MKKRAYTGFLTLSLLVTMAVTTTHAQFSQGVIVADVPFDFYIGDKLLPAGEYSVGQITSSNDTGLLIRSADGRHAAIALTNATQGKRDQPDESKLVFNKYGDQHFLSIAWRSGREGRMLIESRRERELKKELRMARSAGAPTQNPQRVAVAAR